MNKFLEEMAKDEKCPLCGSDILFISGEGWDYDREYCSNRACKYQVEYDTTTYLEDEK